MHTNVSHSQNSNANDGKKSWSGKSRVETIDKEKCIGGGGTQTPVGSIELAGSPHLEESCESRGSSGLASVPCSMSSSCGSPPALKDPSPDWDPEGPAMEPAESEPPKIEMSEGAAVCMIFCRTSLIFSCRHTLVGNISEYLVWKAAVAWAVDKRWNHQEVTTRMKNQKSVTVCVRERKVGGCVLPDGKKPCSWNSCMTSALLWSSVRRREVYGTLSNSSSVKMSSPSGAGKEAGDYKPLDPWEEFELILTSQWHWIITN